MSRSGYSDDYDGWASIRWRGAVLSAIRGKRGQAFLRELAQAMDAMPVKQLVSDELQADGQYCALGVVGAARGKDLTRIDTDDWAQLSREFGISEALAREIMYENDEADFYGIWENRWDSRNVVIEGPMQPWQIHTRAYVTEKPAFAERRWARVRRWVEANLAKEPA